MASESGLPSPASVETPAEGAGDRLLWDRYVARGDQSAFTALVERHGPMVLGVCRRILRHAHDAEDAFQATFLVLAHKAGAVSRPELLGNWLYGVAYRTALKARSRAATRTGESLAADVAAPQAPERLDAEVRAVLDEELHRLPEKYRLPLVLCYLQGQSTHEAAQTLGCPKGTILSRLARGRDRLRQRLERRGMVLAGAAIVAMLCHGSASAGEIAGTLVAGATVGPHSTSLAARTLADNVLRQMRWHRLLTRAAVGLILVAGVVAARASYQTLFAGRAGPGAIATADDRELLQGNWKVTSVRVSGKVIEPAASPIQRLIVRGSRIDFEGSGPPRSASFRLDTAARPKAIDFTDVNNGRDLFPEAIYDLNGDTLTLCQPEVPGSGRPAAFDSPPDSGLVLLVFRRQRY
jgi:RNA polymerase sigma factor (sigma-70 family)